MAPNKLAEAATLFGRSSVRISTRTDHPDCGFRSILQSFQTNDWIVFPIRPGRLPDTVFPLHCSLSTFQSTQSGLRTEQTAKYGLDGLGSIPGKSKIFSLKPFRPTLRPTQFHLQWVPGFLPAVKWPGHEVDHSSPSSKAVNLLYIHTFKTRAGPTLPLNKQWQYNTRACHS